MRIRDISRPVHSGMPVWPGDPVVSVETTVSIAAGGGANVSRLTMGSHSGTHVDAPLHYISGGRSVDVVDLALLVGPALVVEMDREGAIGPNELEHAGVPQGTERLLLKTLNSTRAPGGNEGFRPDYSYLSVDAARWLVVRGIRLVGVDGPSVDGYSEPGGAGHTVLLTNGSVIIEGLDLSEVRPGTYLLCCLPLRILGGDGAPARAVLIG